MMDENKSVNIEDIEYFVYKNKIRIEPYHVPHTTILEYKMFTLDKKIYFGDFGLEHALEMADKFCECEFFV